MTKKNTPWKWEEAHQRAFQVLKEKLANVQGLGVPNSEGEIVLITDSSNVGGGASLYQWQPIEKNQEWNDLGATMGMKRMKS